MRFSTLALCLALAAAVSAPALADPSQPSAVPAAGGLNGTRALDGYVLGLNVGGQLRDQGFDVDLDALLKGVKDGLAGAKPLLSDDRIKTIDEQLQADAQARHEKMVAAAAAKNKTEGAAFLKTNAAKPGVISLPSGLQYQVLTQGAGQKPELGDTVLCNYRGTLIDGTEFDSSAKHGGPATFPVGGVIKGWTEALLLMPVGSKWRLFVPPELGYGDAGAGPHIGPSAVLIFDIELLSIPEKN